MQQLDRIVQNVCVQRRRRCPIIAADEKFGFQPHSFIMHVNGVTNVDVIRDMVLVYLYHFSFQYKLCKNPGILAYFAEKVGEFHFWM